MSAGRPSPTRGATGRAVIDCATQAGIGVIVATSRTLEPRTVYVNDALAALFGYSREELLGKPTLQLAAPESLATLQEIGRALIERRSVPTRMSTVGRHRDGRLIPLHYAFTEVEIRGAPYAVTFVLDLTTDARAREALNASEARFRRLLTSAPEAVWITDVRGILRWVNGAACSLFGVRRPDDVLGTDSRQYIHPEDRTRVEAVIAQVLRREEVPPFSVRAKHGDDGRTLELEVSSIAVEQEGELCVLHFGRDVTEQRRLEVELARSERLALLGDLAGGMAHGINNPLTYVLLNLDHLCWTLPRLASQRSLLSELLVRLRETQHGAERVAAVVRQVRVFSRHGEGGPAPVDLRAVLDNVILLLGNELRHRVDLRLAAEDVPAVMAGPDRMEQLFLSLMVHTLRSLPDGLPTEFSITLGTEGERVFVELGVRVRGSPEVPAALAPLSQRGVVPPALLACQQLVKGLSGELLHGLTREGIECFRVTFPAGQPRAVSSVPPSVSTLPPPSRRARLLVIDDDPGVASALGAMLADRHDVTRVGEARAALRLLVEDDGWDVALCDLLMPELTGRDLYEALARARPGREKRLVFMTGGAFTPELARFLSEVAAPRLEKPFDLGALQRTLANVMKLSGAPGTP